MSIPNLPVDFKDDILNTGVNQKRKYQQTYNSDGSVSFEDVTAYQQKGSNFGAQEVNETNGAVNNIYSERILDLDELELVTEPGFFVDAQAVKEAHDSLNSKMFETGTLLYNKMVSSGTIMLSESIENYKYLRVECCALASGSSLPKNITYTYIPVERIEYDVNTDRCFVNSCLQTPSVYYCVDYNFPDQTHIKILNARVAGWGQARFWRVYGLGRL